VEDSRSVVPVDLDGNGTLDLVIGNNDAEPTVYLNRVARAGNWLELDLVGTDSNRDAIGARVRVRAGGELLMRQVEAGSGYASQRPLTVHFGLGDAQAVEGIEIRWPSGLTERFVPGPGTGEARVNRRLRVVEDSGVLQPIGLGGSPKPLPLTPAAGPSQ